MRIPTMKYLKYLQSVLIHKYYVFIECCKLGIVWRGIIHDWSKFLPCEFYPYANTFFGDWTREDKRFKDAWKHHYMHNKHHWNGWLEPYGDPYEIPHIYVVEMLADWTAMSRQHQNTTLVAPWYKDNKNKMKLHPETRKKIEHMIIVKEGTYSL